MARSKSISFAGQTFRRQVDAIDYVKRYIEGRGVCDIGQVDEGFSIFSDLILLHPERNDKVGVGIDRFKIVRGGYGELTVRLVRIDGSDIDFSWRTCIKQKAMPPELKLRVAMRLAVEDQKFAFRDESFEKGAAVCSLCGRVLESRNDSHVHHDNPSFEKLVRSFLAEYFDDVPTVFDDCPSTNSPRFRAEDAFFSGLWAAYHSKMANLKLTCQPCNLSAPRDCSPTRR